MEDRVPEWEQVAAFRRAIGNFLDSAHPCASPDRRAEARPNLAEYGAPDRGIPACQSCHDFHGRSAERMYPAIGGQRYTYLKHELEAFRLGATTPSTQDAMARGNDPAAQMRKVAAKMSDEDIANVSAFLTVSRPVTPGNPRAPLRD